MARRISRVGAGVAVLTCLLVAQLFRIQVLGSVAGRDLGREAVRQRTVGLPIEVARGLIYDRNHVPLTAGCERVSAVAFPSLTVPALAREPALAARVAGLLGLTAAEVAAALGQPGAPFRLKTGLAPSEAAALNRANPPGVVAVTEHLRYGPDSLARHLIGYIRPHAYQNPLDNVGVDGLERRYDRWLRGSGPLQVVAVVTPHKDEQLSGLGYRLRPAGSQEGGHSLVLTLDAYIQRVVEEELDRQGIERGAAVVVDPYTGEVLAMASRPNFDQNQPQQALDVHGAMVNAAVSAFAPGSVFKLVVAAAALDEGLTELHEVFTCTGEVRAGNRVFTCPSIAHGGHGRLTLQDALAYSCNSVFITLGQRLGAATLLGYAAAFGLGARTGVEIDREAAGLLPRAWGLGPEALANLSLGQGQLEVTPLQLAMVVATLVNDGIMLSPWVVRELRDPRGYTVERAGPGPGQRVVSSETARQLRLAMFAVTTYGTGRLAQTRSRAAGKTGSAETGPGQRTHAYFAGFAPFYVPKYVMVVFAEQAGAGGSVAAPVFGRTLNRLLP